MRSQIEDGRWLGDNIESLNIGSVSVRPFIIGDCAFPLGPNLMKTTSAPQQTANPDLILWERVAADTRKPLERAFGILKNRFMVIKTGLYLHHEDDTAYVITACICFHNMCFDNDDEGNDFEDSDESDNE